MTIPALPVTCGDSSPKGRAKGLHSSAECLHVIRFGRGRAVRPYNRLPYLRLILALSFRASDRRHWRGNPFSFLCLRRPKAATYLCRFAAKARFDNRPHPEGVSKEGGPQPSLFGRSRMRQNAERLARLTPSPSAAPPASSQTASPAPSNSWCSDRTPRSPTWTPPAG